MKNILKYVIYAILFLLFIVLTGFIIPYGTVVLFKIYGVTISKASVHIALWIIFLSVYFYFAIYLANIFKGVKKKLKLSKKFRVFHEHILDVFISLFKKETYLELRITGKDYPEIILTDNGETILKYKNERLPNLLMTLKSQKKIESLDIDLETHAIDYFLAQVFYDIKPIKINKLSTVVIESLFKIAQFERLVIEKEYVTIILEGWIGYDSEELIDESIDLILDFTSALKILYQKVATDE